MIGISACLGGALCRYDGKSQSVSQLMTLVQEGRAIMVCPEVLGGLPIPRDPAEIIGGDGVTVWQGAARVMTVSGQDVTQQFKEGAIVAYQKLQALGINQLILKEKSPSCGSQMIYDGQFSGIKKAGVGVASAYFRQQGMQVMSDVEWLESLEEANGN
ncbi:hypothetical protein A5886_002334 [Enterococcus sp. 8G7_MSG3316]|uniref:Uncharacterized protein n=1 Tax=Candidatus Enterococcus testudinis TaxID=1834191 RepID=A0A242A860_9ENTE|nr:DUF523 domain-containing protein [Enterococcus sp. 8G7_MSG3316]OTN77237.1 hypothetical protein A5886_002334 [Enterococcus sp. 8G7_MSG3316]